MLLILLSEASQSVVVYSFGVEMGSFFGFQAWRGALLVLFDFMTGFRLLFWILLFLHVFRNTLNRNIFLLLVLVRSHGRFRET